MNMSENSGKDTNWVVATQFFFMFIPDPWGNDPILTHIFQMGWFNHQLAKVSRPTGNHFQFGHVQKAPKGELS